MGAAVQADRRANDARGFAKFDYDNWIGEEALICMYKALAFVEPVPENVPFPAYIDGLDYVEDATKALRDVRVYLLSCTVARFLNRLLLVSVDIGKAMLEHFQSIYQNLICAKLALNDADLGLQEVTFRYGWPEKVKCYSIRNLKSGNLYDCQAHIIEAYSGNSFEGVLQNTYITFDDITGFYLENSGRGQVRPEVLYVTRSENIYNRGKPYSIWSPYFQKEDVDAEAVLASTTGYSKKTAESIQYYWDEEANFLDEHCIHEYKFGVCSEADGCFEGKRRLRLRMVDGKLEQIWEDLQKVCFGMPLQIRRVQVKRPDEYFVYGIIIPNDAAWEEMQISFKLEEIKL